MSLKSWTLQIKLVNTMVWIMQIFLCKGQTTNPNYAAIGDKVSTIRCASLHCAYVIKEQALAFQTQQKLS